MGGIDNVQAAICDLSGQDERYGPAMLRRTDEQPEQNSGIDQDEAHPVGRHDDAGWSQVRHHRPVRPDLQPAPHELRVVDDHHEDVEEGRNREQDKIAAGQPAAGVGVLEDEAEAGGNRGHPPDTLESEPGDFGGRGDGGCFEGNSQQEQAAEQRDGQERQCGRDAAAPPAVQADGSQEDDADQWRPDGRGVGVMAGHGCSQRCTGSLAEEYHMI